MKTSPIPELVPEIGKDNVLNPETAEIDQIEGIKLAIKKATKTLLLP